MCDTCGQSVDSSLVSQLYVTLVVSQLTVSCQSVMCDTCGQSVDSFLSVSCVTLVVSQLTVLLSVSYV